MTCACASLLLIKDVKAWQEPCNAMDAHLLHGSASALPLQRTGPEAGTRRSVLRKGRAKGGGEKRKSEDVFWDSESLSNLVAPCG